MKLFNLKSLYDNYLGNLLIFTLLFYLFTSFLIKFFKLFYDVNLILPILAILKLILIIFYLGVLIFNFNKKKILFLYLGLFLIVYFAGNFNWNLDINFVFNSYEILKGGNFFYLIKYLFPFFLTAAFSFVKNKQEVINNYFEILEKVLVVNSFFVFFGFLFSVDFFQSYINTSRFGYSGMLEAGFYEYLLIVVISRKLFLDKIDLKLVVLCIASLFIGTKIMILFFVVLIFYYLYEKRKIKLLVLYSGLVLLSLILLKSIIDLFVKVFPFWQPILNDHGYLTLIVSKRNWNIQNTLEYIKINGTLKNLFFGGLEFSKCGVEMDFIDLFLFFGIIGATIYLVLISKIINKSYHLIPLITAFFSGDFLLSTITIFTYFIWMYESHKERKGLF